MRIFKLSASGKREQLPHAGHGQLRVRQQPGGVG
jgi:hypothetical protein